MIRVRREGVYMSVYRINEPSEGFQLRKIIADRTKTNPDDWFLTFRAREAMQIVCEELRSSYGDGTVILQPYTCSTVPEAVIAGGLTPLYCDISADDLSIDPDVLAPLLEDQKDGPVRSVILQHTYGIFNQSSTDRIAEMIRTPGEENGSAHAPLLIEDCAHRAGRVAFNAESKPIADISVHSFGVEKMLGTTFGAAVWISPEMADSDLRDVLRKHFSSLPAQDPRISRSVVSYRSKIRVLNHLPMNIRKPLRETWVKSKSFVPAVDKSELAGSTLLQPSVPDKEVINRVLAAFEYININEAERQVAVTLYIKELGTPDPADNYTVPAEAISKSRPLLWFPVNVGTKQTAETIVAALAEAGFYSSTWGRPLLFPGVTDPEVFRLNQAVRDCPEALKFSEGVVLLPTNRDQDSVKEVISVFRNTLSECAPDPEFVEFVPILLGTETNVYNMARSFYEDYGIVSQAYGRVPLSQSAYSKFVNVICNSDFTDPESFVRVLNMEAGKYRGKKAILISCGDNYTRILASVKDRLDPVYIPVCPDYEIVDAVNSKVKFYGYCEEAGIPYPKTVVIDSTKIPELPFEFPLVLKPDDADDYYAHPFAGQKKAFILNHHEELISAVNSTYASGYTGKMLIQDFIPGGDDNMRVVNGYKRSDGKVALLSMGRPLLEDYAPMAIGNYNVILASGDDDVYDTVEKLLDSIPYLGYFNMDLKYDSRDGQFKVFDFNPRMGRSSYYVTLAGHNLAKCVVEDVVLHKDVTTERSYDEYLWSDVPYPVIRKYVSEAHRDKVTELVKKGRTGGTFTGSGDKDPRRLMIRAKDNARSVRNYRRYFVSKEDK